LEETQLQGKEVGIPRGKRKLSDTNSHLAESDDAGDILHT
jgi:hypothetical protein